MTLKPALNKTFDAEDLRTLVLHAERLREVNLHLPNVNNNHYHHWEVALALEALHRNGCNRILEVGYGATLFAPTALSLGYEVTLVNPSQDAQDIAAFCYRDDTLPFRFVREDYRAFPPEPRFDAVVALERLDDSGQSLEWFAQLFRFAERLVFVTAELFITGTNNDDDLWLYRADRLQRFQPPGQWRLADKPEWDDSASLASLAFVVSEAGEPGTSKKRAKVRSTVPQHIQELDPISTEISEAD